MNSSEHSPAQYDLHLHSYWSYDATAEVEDHFKRARELGVRYIAIADHHVMDAFAQVLECAKRYPEVTAILSSEITVTTSVGGIDLLCYGFPRELTPPLQELVDFHHDWQRATGAAWSKGLQASGYDFSDADRLALLYTYRPAHVIALQGNTHVKNGVLSDYCVDHGFIASSEEYYDLKVRMRKEVPSPPYPPVDEVLPVLKEAGIKVAIAHPHGYFNQGDRARMDTLRQECQLDGIECAHRQVPPGFTLIYREYCVEHGLFSVGGSDSHTVGDIQELFAGHGGADEWLDEFLGCLAL
jgi:predicted metal-dependent phosphoesterase TrpH